MGSAVSVLSSSDPVRLYQSFATVDLISNGRAELMVGRGSFTGSFPLFGYDLADYNELFEEKLELLLQINKQPRVIWNGKFRPALENQQVLPRAVNDALDIWIAVGGTPESVVRAAKFNLPVIFAISIVSCQRNQVELSILFHNIKQGRLAGLCIRRDHVLQVKPICSCGWFRISVIASSFISINSFK